jgi:hypothetical protein
VTMNDAPAASAASARATSVTVPAPRRQFCWDTRPKRLQDFNRTRTVHRDLDQTNAMLEEVFNEADRIDFRTPNDTTIGASLTIDLREI